MQKKLALRLVIGLFTIAILFVGYNWLKEFVKDPNVGASDTTGMVAAIQFHDDGARAVAFRANGDMLESPDWKESDQDQQISWSPNGSRVFVSSNRGQDAFNIFAWYPEKNIFEQRSIGSRSQSVPWFPIWATPNEESTGLITAGGFVLAFDPKERTTRQILPPVAKDRISGEGGEGGSAGTLDALYSRLGSSFREAKWGKDKESIYAVMRRDDGEILIINRLVADDPRMLAPVAYRAANEIQFDTTPEGGAVVVIRGFQFPDKENIEPEFIKNGVAVPPYRNEVSAIKFNEQGQPVPVMLALVQDDKNVFYDPAVSPDGTKLAIVIVEQEGETRKPLGLVIMPLEERGAERGTMIVAGEISMPSWSPDGTMLTYLKRQPAGNNSVFTIKADGSGERRLTDEGDFTSPKFSPMLVKK